MTTEPDATTLLDDIRTLRERVRRDRRGYAFPLFLFGALILLAPLCYVRAEVVLSDLPEEFELVPIPVDEGPFPQFIPIFASDLRYPGLIGWYWVLTIVVGLAATGWWYRRRARRLGVETDTRLPFVVAGAALAGFLLVQPLLGTILAEAGFYSLYSEPEVNLPILFGSAALSVAALTWCGRPQRTDRLRLAGMFAGALFASVAVASVGVYMIHGYSALLAVAVLLLVLAWAERSVLLGVIGTLFTGSALLVNLYNIENLYYRMGWVDPDTRVLALQSVLLPAAVLLGGGLTAAVTSRARR